MSHGPAPETVVDLAQDPSLEVYARLTERAVRVRDERFIAEGTESIRLLLKSPFAVESVLLTPGHLERLRPEIAAAASTPRVFVAEPALLRRITGFPFHRGALACGRRRPARETDALVAALPARTRWRLVALDGIADVANVGSLIRTAHALGLDGMIVGPGCGDPLYRRAIRVSMGHVFQLPLYATADLAASLRALAGHGVEACAATIPRGVASSTSVAASGDEGFTPPPRWILVLGNEERGVSDTVLDACRHRVGIAMAPGVDSLSVVVAGGLLMSLLGGARVQRA